MILTNKEKKMKKIVFLISAIALFIGIGYQASASEFNFAVTPNIPDNQVDKTKTYFDLKLNQNTEQDLTMELRNDTENEVTIELSVNSATTNMNGVVEYGSNKIKQDKSLKYNLKDLVTIQSEVKIPAKSKQSVPLRVKMPNEKISGVLAGGITLKEKKEEENKKSAASSGMAIKNEYSYVVALLMRQSTAAIKPNLLLQNVAAGQNNARNVIQANLQNPEPTYLNQLKVQAEITKKGSSKVLFHSEKSGMQMAPNSNFDYPIALNGAKLAGGNYHIKIVAYGGKNENGSFTSGKDENGLGIKYTYKWTLEKDFTIKDDVAKKLNQKDVSIKQDNTWLYFLIALLIVLVVIFLVIWKRKKQKHDEKE